MVKKIAITGGIGSGKSLVLECIKEWGYPVFSCDEIYKELLQTKEFSQKITAAFPTCVKDEKIDRKELANIVCNNKEQLELLNKISHPIIMKTFTLLAICLRAQELQELHQAPRDTCI